MNKIKIDKTAILEYVRTIFIALLIALFIAAVATGCSKSIAEQHARMLEKISNNAKDTELITYLISRYQEEAVKNPGDYSINVKLGNLYELIFNYDSAEKQYKKAIDKSPYGVYSSFLGLANLYVKQAKYEKALNIVKQLKNTNHKPLLIAKGDFYMNLGDAMWERTKYLEAVKQYKIAFFYYKKVSSNKKDAAINGILDCYNKIADVSYRRGDIYHAIESLETAILYKETPVLDYKLAILYKDVNPLKANEYIEKTYKTDPGIINFDIYEEILIRLITNYYYEGKDIETDLYKQKLKAIRNFQRRYVVTERDVKINIHSIKYKENLFKTKKKLSIKYKIENTSKNDFNILYVIVKIRDENKSKEISNLRLYSKKEPLKSRTESSDYVIKYEVSHKDEMYLSDKIWIDFYVGRKDNMRKLPVFSYQIKNN